MRSIMMALLVMSTVWMACNDVGKKAEASEAENVTVRKTAATKVYNRLLEGSHLKWRAAHLGGVEPRYGKVDLSAVEVLVNNGEVSNLSSAVDMGTIVVENFKEEKNAQELKAHLENEDFFKIQEFPTSRFELTNIAPGSGDYNAVITGNLTMLGVSKSISFKANVEVGDDQVSIRSEDFSVDRKEWGLTYHTEGTTGVPADYLIADDIGFTIDIKVGM